MRLISMLCLFIVANSAWGEPIEYGKKVTLKSKSFNEQRVIRVSLPLSYDSNNKREYPVIYVARGQLDFLSTIASLDLLADEVPEFIVVGVDGTGGEFFPSKDGTQTKFSRLLHDEVLPYITQTYRTAPYTVLLAHSNAGRFVANDWLEKGSSFSRYIAISPSLNDGYINAQSKTLKTAQLKNKSALLITMADEGGRMEKLFKELEQLLSDNDIVTFEVFADQTHMSTRANAIMHGLRQAFNNWEPKKEVQQGELDGLVQHYKNLSEEYGFDVEVPLEMLSRMGGFQSWSDDTQKNENAAAAVKYALARNPKDADEFFNVAGQLSDLGAAEGNKRLISYICKELPRDERCPKK